MLTLVNIGFSKKTDVNVFDINIDFFVKKPMLTVKLIHSLTSIFPKSRCCFQEFFLNNVSVLTKKPKSFLDIHNQEANLDNVIKELNYRSAIMLDLV